MKFKHFHQPFINVVLIAALSLVALSQQPTSSTPSVDRLRQVITYLASDALEGRRTGTKGANEAANYIAGEFSGLGLRAAFQPAHPARPQAENLTRYFQPFPYVSSILLGKANFLSI